MMFLLFLACGQQDALVKKSEPSMEEKRIPAGDVLPIHNQIIRMAMTSDSAYERLSEMCDDFGPRISGSLALERAGDWMMQQLEQDGLTNLNRQPVMVQHWIRGQESLQLLSPHIETLPMLGLGMSVGTDGLPIEGEVIVVQTLDDLKNSPAQDIKDKVVLINQPFEDYGKTVKIRMSGPTEAAKLGAKAALIRSVAPHGHQTPHTGATSYVGEYKIPAAAISLEDAERLSRFQDRGKDIRVSLTMDAEMGSPAESSNVMGDIKGHTLPNEVVAMGCHLDSWDVGQGAQDDGAGCMMVLEAARILRMLPDPPKRTIRAVFFTNEENGLAGGRQYAESHSGSHFAAIEADIGAGAPQYFSYKLPEGGVLDPLTKDLDALMPALRTLGMNAFQAGFAGADINPLVGQGVIGFGLKMDTAGYWPIHHTHADTVDKVDPVQLKRNSAAIALLAWTLANAE